MITARNLTKGPVTRQLVSLSLPVIASSVMQMGYNLADIFWVGRISASDISAVSAAGYVIWFGFSLTLISKVGVEVLVAQAAGRNRLHRAPVYAATGFSIAVALSFVFASVCFIMPGYIISSIFSFSSDYVSAQAASYLKISSLSFPFMFANPVASGYLSGLADTKTAFRIAAAGIIANIVLDPLFIFGAGFLPAMGVQGAAAATVAGSFISFALFARELYIKRNRRSAPAAPKFRYAWQIIRIGLPISAQLALFSVFAMAIARIVSPWGDIPIAVINVAGNIEAVSWMAAGGLSTALSAFSGQNFGAGNISRLRDGYNKAMYIALGWGGFTAAVLYFFGGSIMSIFSTEPEFVRNSASYMRIVAISQIFMCIEIGTSGAFSGLGRTMPSAIVGIGFNAARVAAAYLLSARTSLGLEGVWWSISLSSVCKGAAMFFWYKLQLRRITAGAKV
jgi:putative MATE family efflux protein